MPGTFLLKSLALPVIPPFQEDFNRSDRDLDGDNGWTNYGHGWEIVNGEARAIDFNSRIYRDLGSTDQDFFVYVTPVPVTGLEGHNLLVQYGVDVANYYGYSIEFFRATHGSFRVSYEGDTPGGPYSAGTIVETVNPPSPAGPTFKVRVKVEGNLHTIWINDEQAYQFTHSTIVRGTSAGFWAFNYDNGDLAKIDNFNVDPVYTDNFNRSNADPNLDGDATSSGLYGPWSVKRGVFVVSNNYAQATSAPGANGPGAMALLQGPGGNQDVTVRMIDSPSDTHYGGLVLLSDSTGTNFLQFSTDLNGTFYVHRWNGGSFTNIIPNQYNARLAANDGQPGVRVRVRAEVTGEVSVWANGVLLATGTDPSPLSGAYFGLGSDSVSTGYDDLEAAFF